MDHIDALGAEGILQGALGRDDDLAHAPVEGEPSRSLVRIRWDLQVEVLQVDAQQRRFGGVQIQIRGLRCLSAVEGAMGGLPAHRGPPGEETGGGLRGRAEPGPACSANDPRRPSPSSRSDRLESDHLAGSVARYLPRPRERLPRAAGTGSRSRPAVCTERRGRRPRLRSSRWPPCVETARSCYVKVHIAALIRHSRGTACTAVSGRQRPISFGASAGQFTQLAACTGMLRAM
jgi:hypothetical protein